MAFLKLCTGDDLVNTLQSVFHANIIRIPEARLRPLAVIAVQSGKPSFWGYLEELVEGSITGLPAAMEQSPMANVSGKRSKSVSVAVGLQILEGFLNGFNLPAASIATQFTGAKTVSFSFQQVVRSFISPGQLGRLLQGHALDAGNGSNALFLNREAQLLVVDSVITSKDFSINVDKEHSSDFSLNIPAIQKIVGEAKADIKVASSTGLDITFQGEIPLSFAFTCVEAKLDAAGRISLQPSSSVVLLSESSRHFEHQLLYNEPCMIEL